MASTSDDDFLVKKYDILADCLPDTKNVRTIWGAAIFYLNDTSSTKKKVNCHYEVEAPKDFDGFHVYIDEMYLFEKKKRCAKDFLQFGR